MTETTTDTPPAEPTEEEVWAAEQDRLRIEQNLPEGSVPEQRPQAAVSPDANARHSQLYKDLEEADELPGNEPMGFDAYKRARSESQAEKAAKASKTPRLLDGTRVVLTKKGHENRPAVIQQTNFKNEREAFKAASGVPHVSMFAEVESYVVKTRDSRTDVLTVKPDELKALGVDQGWSRGE